MCLDLAGWHLCLHYPLRRPARPITISSFLLLLLLLPATSIDRYLSPFPFTSSPSSYLPLSLLSLITATSYHTHHPCSPIDLPFSPGITPFSSFNLYLFSPPSFRPVIFHYHQDRL